MRQEPSKRTYKLPDCIQGQEDPYTNRQSNLIIQTKLKSKTKRMQEYETLPFCRLFSVLCYFLLFLRFDWFFFSLLHNCNATRALYLNLKSLSGLSNPIQAKTCLYELLIYV